MKILLYPFFNIQNKQSRRFRLFTDSSLRFYMRLAERLEDVSVVLPQEQQCEDEPPMPGHLKVVRTPFLVSLDNLDRRIQWEPGWFRSLAVQYDVIVTQHEYLPYVFRAVRPPCKVIVECGYTPETSSNGTDALFPLAWKAADLVHVSSDTLARQVQSGGGTTTVWEYAYDERQVKAVPWGSRSDTVLFNARCSSNNYTRHQEFLQSIDGLDVIMTDQSRYLSSSLGYTPANVFVPPPLTHGEYLDLLRQCKVVVGLIDNGYGGYALREAVAHGMVPVTIRTPEYEKFLGPDWPYYATFDTLNAVLHKAINYGWSLCGNAVVHHVTNALTKCSYKHVCEQAVADIRGVYDSRR